MAKGIFKWGLLAYVAVTLGVIVWQECKAGPLPGEPGWEAGDYLMVTYFHSDKRCETCNNMEAYTKEAVETFFAAELASGNVKMRVLNWQSLANAGYTKKYALLGNAVIVSQIKDGQETRFKNLEDVWSLAHDRKEFVEYVREEVQAWSGGA